MFFLLNAQYYIQWYMCGNVQNLKSIKISAIPVFNFISTKLNANRLWPNCNPMLNFSSYAKFYSGEGESSKMFLIKEVHVCFCSCSFGFISQLELSKGIERTVIATMAPNLSPPKYKWNIQTGRKLNLVSLLVKKFSLKKPSRNPKTTPKKPPQHINLYSQTNVSEPNYRKENNYFLVILRMLNFLFFPLQHTFLLFTRKSCLIKSCMSRNSAPTEEKKK